MTRIIFTFLTLYVSLGFMGCFDTKSNVKFDNKTTINNQQDRTLDTISPEEAKNLISTMNNLTILDVRTPNEFNDGYINGAKNIDYYSDTFRDDLAKYDITQPYLIYCRSGSRSGKTLAIMDDLGFEEVYNMDGGFNAWASKGFPIVK